MKKLIVLIAVLLTICTIIYSRTKGLAAVPFVRERVFFVEERITLRNLPQNISNLRVWIPYPVSDRWQVVSDFKMTSPFDSTVIVDKKYGNKIIYLESKSDDLDKAPPEVFLSFKVKRKELTGSSESVDSRRILSMFLRPNNTVPVNDELKALAEKITSGKKGEMQKVRAIYDYILGELSYSNDDSSVCGVGNTLITLEAKKGICTDYHSLFISLARSLGVPAKFEIGYRIPAGQNAGKLPGYHCWAKFYSKGRGWIPVDISEADKHPEKQDYYFGNIDANRFHLTTGRDISLKNAGEAQPLNFFVYPYAELDDKMLTSIDLEVKYRDLDSE